MNLYPRKVSISIIVAFSLTVLTSFSFATVIYAGPLTGMEFVSVKSGCYQFIMLAYF